MSSARGRADRLQPEAVLAVGVAGLRLLHAVERPAWEQAAAQQGSLEGREIRRSRDHGARRPGEIDHAVKELRELSRGLHPAILSDLGLDAALRSLADRAPTPVELQLRLDGRRSAAVEAAA